MLKNLKFYSKKFLIPIFALLSFNSLAQTIPNNATKNSYNNEWYCNKGFYQSDKKCLEIKIPQNAELSYFGNDWVCKKGFYKSQDKCLEVKIPQNAKISYLGDSWVCNSGFYKLGNKCLEVKIPENAELNYFGNDWICKDGFKKSGNRCLNMTLAEIKKQEELKKAAMLELQRKIMLESARRKCNTEYKTGAEVCVAIIDSSLNCNQSYADNYYNDCDVNIEYRITTDYKGNSYLDTKVECEVEIEYKSKESYISNTDSELNHKNHSVYSNAYDRYSMDFNFSFYNYQQVNSVKLTDVNCKIKDINLW